MTSLSYLLFTLHACAVSSTEEPHNNFCWVSFSEENCYRARENTLPGMRLWRFHRRDLKGL